MMFDCGTDDVITVLYQPGYREVVSLSAAAGKYDLSRTATQQRSDRFASTFDRGPRLLTVMMNGGGVPEVVAKVRPHHFQNVRQYRGRGVVVEVNAPHTSIVFPLHKLST